MDQKKRVQKKMKFLKSLNQLMIWLNNNKKNMKEVMEMINKMEVERDSAIKINNKTYLIFLFLN